jgi:hypothetical protein
LPLDEVADAHEEKQDYNHDGFRFRV